jgi:DNA-directed RNA polymerase specialized sigma24 family protein
MSQDELLDADLLAAVPDADAVRVLYERHVDAVFRFAVRRCRNPDDVADLVSAVFLELFSAAAGYDRSKGKVRPWLLGIAARCLADQRRGELEMIINPTTGQLLQTSRTLLHRSSAYVDGKQPPGLINRATYLAMTIVSSTHARAH